MKKIKTILANVALLVFVVSFAIFVISLFAGLYTNVVWSGLTAFLSFSVLIVSVGPPDNDTYLKNTKNHRH